MKKLTLLLLLCGGVVQAQVSMGVGGFYSQPLDKFNRANYQQGFGFELGAAYQFRLFNPVSMELNTHVQWGKNGQRTTSGSWGNYQLNNQFANWLGEIKWIYNINDWKPYAGIHLGVGVYETKEQSKSNNSSINTYQNNVHEQGLFQLGFSLGSYYELTEGLLLDLSISTNFGSRSVDFFDIKSYNYQQGMATYESKSSTPCLLLFNIGLTLELENLRDSGENDDFEQHREINIPPARTPAPRPAPHPKTPRKRGHHTK